MKTINFSAAMRRTFRSLPSFVVMFLIVPRAASAITIDTVPIGNAGNGNDRVGYGRVSHDYRIGTTEVTVGQYAAFLNAVAAADSYALYNTRMAVDVHVAGIARSGASGTFAYSTIGSPNKPITYVNWGDAARFCNWLNNGQPTGGQVAGSTEDGAYRLNGAVTDAALNAITRRAGATWFIPTENEWYKAAYHKNNGPTSDYWSFPTGTNAAPNSDQPPGDPNIQTNVGNLYRDDGLANGYNDGYAVTGSTSNSIQNNLTDVEAYSATTSPYGAFDMGGNVFQWNEASINVSSFRGWRGGSWNNDWFDAQSSIRNSDRPTAEFNYIGFRVATVAAAVPEPATLLLLIVAAAGIRRMGGRKRQELINE